MDLESSGSGCTGVSLPATSVKDVHILLFVCQRMFCLLYNGSRHKVLFDPVKMYLCVCVYVCLKLCVLIGEQMSVCELECM